MKLDRVVIVVLVLSVLMQGTIMYRQRRQFPSSFPARPSPVQDVHNHSQIEIDGLPIRGKKEAKVVLMEFSDYECPFCARHAKGVGQDLLKEFDGRVKQVFLNNPLPMHSNAKMLATGAICAGQQNRYWEMHDELFRSQPKTKSDLLSVAQKIEVALTPFQECLENSEEPAKRIDEDQKQANDFQFTMTPGFVVGVVDGSGHLNVRKLITGAQPLEVFEKAINEVLFEVGRS